MNYLVVLPKFVGHPGEFYFFPLGICYIASALKKAGRQVVTLNLNEYAESVPQVLGDIIGKHHIDVVCTGALSANYNQVKDIVLAAKGARPGIITVAGGGVVSSEPLVVMEGLGADIGVIGEGDHTICELAEALEQGSDLMDVDGLVFWKEGRLLATRPRKEAVDLAAIPWPDYDGFGFADYLDTIANFPSIGRYVQMIGSRSCPYDCTFCYHPVGKKYRQRDLDDLFAEMDDLLPRFRVDYLSISDEIFSLDRNRTNEFCRRMKERVAKYGIGWDIQIRVDHVDRELLALLKDAGCSCISYGLESADNTVLKSMKKGTTVAQIEKALALTREAGIDIQGGFIFGDLAETMETADNTLTWWRDHIRYNLNLAHIRVFPGTHLYRQACEHGIIPDRLKYLENGCPLINVSKLDAEEFQVLTEKIQHHWRTCLYPPEKMEILGFKGNTCQVAIVCRTCHGTSEKTYYPFAAREANRVCCPHCRSRLDLMGVLDILFTQRLDAAFNALFMDGRNVALWGCGGLAKQLLEASTSLQKNPILLVDKDACKHRSGFMGRAVAPPDLLREQRISTVIIASSVHAEAIHREIREVYPEVDRVIKLTDLTTLFAS